ncbi:CRTAC1 family protein [Terriglobus sp.]|uniref:CRTAC1 family protein n=1 Tax=Terriglobus sp. TaxID=1889013 RepID=UPI003B0075F9
MLIGPRYIRYATAVQENWIKQRASVQRLDKRDRAPRRIVALASMLRAFSILTVLFTCVLCAHAQQKSSPYSASAQHPSPAWFVDVAAKAGITVRNVNGSPTNKKYIVEATGSGVAILDYDRDGWQDIFLVNGTELNATSGAAAPTNHLFRNNHDGTFIDVTARTGLVSSGWGQGACVGDYDNDGFDDIFVTGYGKNRLFHNDGGTHFTEVAEQAGVAGSGKEWGTGCAFIDYDRDGRLDVIVANYVHFDLAKTPKPGEEAGCTWKGTPVMCGPRGLPYAANSLFHNDGPDKAGGKDGRVHFSDVSVKSGITKTDGHYCFSVTTLDYDEDGWPDMYVACDSTPAILYRNHHDGTFTDEGANAGAAFNEDGREQAGMGATAADFDGDGHLDLFKTNFSDDTATLYHANGDGSFTDVTRVAGLGIHTDALGWGAAFADVDNDGRPDLLVVNGHVYPEVDSAKLGASFREPRFLYWNAGGGKFQDLSKQSGPGLAEPLSGRGLAVADLWNDGRMSAVVNNLDDRPLLLVNEAANRNHWLGLRLIGMKSNRDAIGARVTVRVAGHAWVDEVRSGSSYNSSSDLRLHFGLGAADKVESVLVRWPNGQSETFAGPAVDGIRELREGSGKVIAP